MLLLSLWPAVVFAQAVPEAGMLRYPDVSATQIVFVYAGDLWTVDREGGVASPLASPPGSETNPRFSPDGSQIAFVGNYEAGQDLYICPTVGGIAERVLAALSGELHVGEISEALSVPVRELLPSLMEMELANLVEKRPGNYYKNLTAPGS